MFLNWLRNVRRTDGMARSGNFWTDLSRSRSIPTGSASEFAITEVSGIGMNCSQTVWRITSYVFLQIWLGKCFWASRVHSWPVFMRLFSFVAPFVGHPSSYLLPFFLPLRKVLCSVEQGAQHTAWKGGSVMTDLSTKFGKEIPSRNLREKRSDSAVNQRGRERKGPPEIIQKFRLRNWPISSADFPMTPVEGTEHHKLALFRRRILGQYPAAPCSPGPFVLLLTDKKES